MREFLHGEPQAEERNEVEWIAERLQSPLGEATAPAAAPSLWDRIAGSFPAGGWAWAGAAAALLAAIVFVVPDAPPTLPGGLGQGPPIVRSGQLRVIGPVGAIAAPPPGLAVEAAPGAAVYRFDLRGVDRALLWSAESSEARVSLPGEVSALALPGKTLVWTATALDASGQTVAESPPSRFAVQPEATR